MRLVVRIFVAVLAGLTTLVVSPLPGFVVAPAEAVGPAVLPFSVTNDSGRSDAVYLYVVGVDLASGRLGYADRSGAYHPWPAGSNPPSPAPDVSIPGPAAGATSDIALPKGFSGRIYMSFGARLDFRLTPDGLVQPAPWSAGDPNHDTLFDWSEFTYDNSGLYLNSSQVDMFAVPHLVSVTGSDGRTSTEGRLVADGRQRIIDAVRAQPGWGDALVTRSDGTVLRVLAPGKAAGAGLFATTYLDPYIADAWNAYTTKTLTVQPFADQPGTRYYGRTSGTTLRFTDSAGQQVATFERPSSLDVWGCDGRLGAPNDQVVGPIARTLCAALHRSTLGRIDTQPAGGPGDFYQGTLTDHYARIIHTNMVDGRAYGFAFDDVQAQESLVQSSDPRSAGITLTPFGAGDTTSPPPTTTTVAQRIIGPGSKCVDVEGDDWGTNSAGVWLWDCQSGSVDQQWTWSGGTLRTLGRCLNIAGNHTDNRSPVQLYDCNGGAEQRWVQQGNGSLRNPASGRCLDSPSGATDNRTALQIYDCNASPAQAFRVGGPTIVGPAGRCVDVDYDDIGGNNATVQLYDCQAYAADQHWAPVEGTLRTLGRCLDIDAGGADHATANQTKVQLHDCNGGANQQWVQTGSTLRNPASGRCLDARAGATGNRTPLQIYDCNGSPAQNFVLT